MAVMSIFHLAGESLLLMSAQAHCSIQFKVHLFDTSQKVLELAGFFEETFLRLNYRSERNMNEPEEEFS